MKHFRTNLTFKIALLVICVEMIAFGVLGWFYIDRFSSAAGDQLRSRLQLVGRLIAREELQIDAISRRSLISDLVGAQYLTGMVIGGNRRVIVSTDDRYLGRAATGIPGFDPRWLARDAHGVQFIRGDGTLTAVMRLNGSAGRSIYHAVVTVSTAAIDAQRRAVVLRGWSASLAFIVLSSLGIILLVHRLVGRRVEGTLGVLKEVERGALETRIPVTSSDEMGQLQLGINSMIGNIGALLGQHRRNEKELGAILESISDGLIAADIDGRVLRSNAPAQHLLGERLLPGKRQPLDQVLPMPAQQQAMPWERSLRDGETLRGIRFTLTDAGGRERSLDMTCSPVRDADGGIIGAVLVLRDITERQAAEEQLRLAANVFTHAREGIVITDADANIVNVNAAFSQITGYSREEAIGQNPRILKSDRQGEEFYLALWRSLLTQGYWVGEIWNRRKNGELYAEMLTISAVRDAEGKTQQYVGLFFDITVQKEHQQQLEYIAHYDALTQLPNRVLLADRLHQSMVQAQRRRQLLAVVYLDLDGFKAVNDQYGHDVGDRLLVTVAHRMKDALREGDTIARLGGDEFVAVLIDLAAGEDSQPLLERLLAAVAQPARIDNVELQVSASAGITFYPQTEPVDADQLLRQADQAMYQAKLSGRNRYHLFDTEQDRSVRGHHESVENIRRALQEREFVLYYQPQVNMHSGEVVGVEGLIRWQHPERGLLPPGLFLPVIEDHALSIELGEWVLDSALTQLEAWRAAGLDISVSVNVGARQLQQADFTERLRQRLAGHPTLGPGDLKLEVLETSALNDINHVSRVIADCAGIGVSFALDDFGTGYSSLTYLKRLPADQLKIDRSFVRDMLDDPEDLAILEGVLSLATAFHRQVVAEGVETGAQGEMLLQLGCELAQGYYIARPMPAEAFAGWVKEWRPDPAWAGLQPASHADLTLLSAGVELRAWVRELEEYLTGSRMTPPPLDRHQSRFGAWIRSEGHARYGDSAGLHALEESHRRLHTLAAELVGRQVSSDPARVISRLPEVHGLRDRILREITTLRHDPAMA